MPAPPTALDLVEQLQLPDVLRLERMPSWPEWVASRIASLRIDVQPDSKTGKWQAMPTLPPNLILRANERDALVEHVAALEALCTLTPSSNPRAEEEALVVVTKMMLVLPSMTQNELSAEARGEAFMAALDDLPSWAVRGAVRLWYRGACDKANEAYDYHWCPAPAELRRIAWSETYRVKGRAESLRQLLGAEPRLEFSNEHCHAMRGRLAELFRTSGSPPVGKDGSGGGVGEPPINGAHCGTQPRHSPA